MTTFNVATGANSKLTVVAFRGRDHYDRKVSRTSYGVLVESGEKETRVMRVNKAMNDFSGLVTAINTRDIEATHEAFTDADENLVIIL